LTEKELEEAVGRVLRHRRRKFWQGVGRISITVIKVAAPIVSIAVGLVQVL
jgi:hypothetical protein